MKILVIRFSSIGDIVLTTPVVRCLKKQLGAEVHFLTKRAFASITESNPYIDKVYCTDKQISDVIPGLRAENYDLVVDLHHNLRTLRVKLALGKPASSFNKINAEKWLKVNWGVNLLPRVHIVDRYLDTVSRLGVHNDGEGLDYFIPDTDLVEPDGLGNTPYIAFVIGATHNTKRLPREKMLEICNGIEIPVAVLGGKQEAEDGEWLAARSQGTVVNLCGKLNLNQSASVVKQSELVLAHDTGLMHIAAALHKKIVCIWGNTIPAFGMYPYYPEGAGMHTDMEVEGLSCRPCSKIGFEKCPKGHFKCMNMQDVGFILAETKRLLQS
jgi:ADP-heptose:LPS heptosyltransferase